MKFLRLVPFLVFCWVLTPTNCNACIVRFRDAGELKQEATIVVLATVLSKEVGERYKTGETYSYKIEILSTERGSALPKFTNITYFNLRASVRDGLAVCPIKDGAGIETELKLNGEYRFFLKDSSTKEILYSEELN